MSDFDGDIVMAELEDEGALPASILNSQMASCLQAMQELTDPICLAGRVASLSFRNDKYSLIMHANACSYRMLGMSKTSVAQALGICPETLNSWMEHYPMLREDMDRAAQLTKASVIKILLKLMQGDGTTALNAVKFWLKNCGEEFKDTRRVEVANVATDRQKLIAAMRDIYGLDEDENGDTDSTGNGESACGTPTLSKESCPLPEPF